MKKLFLCLLALSLVALAPPAKSAEPVKEWSILVFLNGDNNLDSYGTKDMKEMEMIGSTDKVNIIVLRDTAQNGVTTKIYYVEKGKSTVVKDYGTNLDTGNWNNLVDFFKYAKTNYPAKHYLMDIWNHGAGWLKRNQDILKGISYDDHSGNHITTQQLRLAFNEMKALNDGKNIDIFGMDACLMQMNEVVQEVMDSVDVVSASEETEPGNGWAYELFLKPLVEKPTMGAEELSMVLQREYVNSYNNGPQGNSSVQGSSISTAKYKLALTQLGLYLDYAIPLTMTAAQSFKSAASATQAFYYSDNKDLIHFLTLTLGQINDPQYKTLADQTIQAFKNAVVSNFKVGNAMSNAQGLAVWIPNSASTYTSKRVAYQDLNWAKETRWANFLDGLLYPQTPVVTFTKIQPLLEDPNGMNPPGAKIKFQVEVKNESPVVAKSAKAVLIAPLGFENATTIVNIGDLGQTTQFVTGLGGTIGRDMAPGKYPFKFQVQMTGYKPVERTITITVDKEYTVEAYPLASDHPYKNSYENTWVITKSGAAGLRIHFPKFETEEKYDVVTLYDKKDTAMGTFDGNFGAFWSPYIEGDTIKIKFKTDSSVNKYGFDIDKIAY